MSIYTGESRGELLAWLAELLGGQTITKVEEGGKGYVYCQVLDSIFGDLPMSKVKFNAKSEWEYLENFKILQKSLKLHQVDKPIPVERLVKCKMQDNLEFLQWMKKFWDANTRGDEYDAAGRSGGFVPSAASTSRTPAARTAPRVAGTAPRSISTVGSAQLEQLRGQVAELQEAFDATAKERDFYFDKLRNIEVIVQARSGVEGLESGEKEMIDKIQEILYSTEEGFELPGSENGNGVEAPVDDEDEAF